MRRQRAGGARNLAHDPRQKSVDTDVSSAERIPDVGLTVTDGGLGDAQVIAVRGALDLHSVGLLEDVIARVWTPAITAMTLDLSGLTFIDSCGLWTITTVNKWCARGRVKLELIPGPESVHNVFELTGLSDVLPFGMREAGRPSAMEASR